MVKNKFWMYGIILIAGISVISSCKKYFDPPPFFEEEPVVEKQTDRKILFIGIDGAAGAEYKKIAPEVMVAMEAHSKYSWEAVSDDVTTDGASWKTLLSGVSYSRHLIEDSTLIYTQPEGSNEHEIIPTYPTFLNYLLGSDRTDTRIGAVVSWGTLASKLMPQAQDNIVAENDKKVRDAAVELAKKPESDVIFVQFNSPAKAGLQYGFSADQQGYVDAVKEVDGYIGDLLAALKSRAEYNKNEEWLVIVQGTHGGIDNTYGGATTEETTVPVFYYNEKFNETEFVQEGLFTGIQINGTNDAAIHARLLNDGGKYNPKRGEYTMQIKVKGTSGSYPHFMSKMSAWPSQPGYSLFTAGANWAMSIRSDNSGERRIQGNSQPAFDGTWHTITFTIADSADGKKYINRFSDGIVNETVDITGIYNDGGSVETTFPLTLGWGADPNMGASDFTAADIMIFDKALTEGEVFDNICLVDVTKHPQYDHLIGYWPASDGFGGRFKNQSPKGDNIDFVLDGNYQWTKINDMPCTVVGVTEPGKESLLVKSVDMAANFFYWLRLETKDSWQLEGTHWLDQFELEFIGL